jgi:hypothetical protein
VDTEGFFVPRKRGGDGRYPDRTQKTTRKPDPKEEEVKFEFENGRFAGTAEWEGPGRVTVEMDHPGQKQWFEEYFRGESAFMTGPVECGEMAHERRDESEVAFTRAAYALAAYSYRVRQGDAGRRAAYGTGAPRS